MWDDYYYEKNMQGDIVRVYNSDGVSLVSYVYTAWGEITSTTYHNSGANTTVTNNPFRYRGYYYDRDLGLYCTSTRYYDSNIGRWISPDSVMSGVGGDISGYNLYAYCFNNPVNMVDHSGSWPSWNDITTVIGIVGELITEVVSTIVQSDAFQNSVQVVSNIRKDIEAYDASNEDEDVVLEANYFSSYKETFVIKVPGDFGLSYGVIILGNDSNATTLNHEYGHKVQLNNMGLIDYTLDVAAPSITAYFLAKQGKLPYDYYSSPWEAGADYYGGVERKPFKDPWTESDGYFLDLLKLF